MIWCRMGSHSAYAKRERHAERSLCSPLKLDFGTITVGFTKTLSVVITNKSKCNLYIELKMMQTSKDENQEKAH